MGTPRLLSILPVLRLLIPLVVGIVLFRLCNSIVLPISLAAAAIILLLALFFVKKSPASLYRIRSFSLLPLFLVMIGIGWLAARVAAPAELDLDRINGKTAVARVEAVVCHEKSMEMHLKLLEVEGMKGDSAMVGASHIVLSTSGCDYSITAGDLISFPLALEPIRNLGNRDEMDYASYLYYKGFRYRQHTRLDNVSITGFSPTLMTRATALRQKLEHKVLNSNLSPQSQSLAIAVMLGDDNFIDRETREHFAVVGVAHVLALSGLHVAIIVLLMWLLLFPLDYIGLKKLRLGLTLLLLLGYDFLTGMSASVVRSTVMIAFVIMSALFHRKLTPLNSLAAAALLILVLSPGSLYSVGFQLSFVTVTALIVFYQTVDIKYRSNGLLKYLFTLLLTSLVAIVSTTILTAYYFNTVSVMSVVANFIVLPIFPVFMIVAVVVLLLFTMGHSVSWLNAALDGITEIIDGSVDWLSTWSFGHSDVYVTWVAVVVYYAIAVMVAMWLYRRNVRWLLGAGAVLAIGLAHSIVVDARVPSYGLMVFNSYNSTPVLCYSHGRALLWVPDVESDFDVEAFRRYHKAFFAHYRIDSVELADNSAVASIGDGVVKHPYALLCGKTIVAVGKGHWKMCEPSDSSEIRFDVLLVTKQFHSTIERACELYDVKSVLLSGDIYDENRRAFESECRKLKLSYYSINASGAYVVER